MIKHYVKDNGDVVIKSYASSISTCNDVIVINKDDVLELAEVLAAYVGPDPMKEGLND